MTSFVRPHPPFDAPASYFDIYKNKELAEPAKSDWMNPSLTQRDGKIMDNIHGCSDKALQHDAMAGYYASITHIDHQIGRLITALENDETYDDTIIIFTSDHGEMLFDHCLFRKVLPYEGSTHIPLLVHVGKNIAKINPHEHSGIVELRDIMPTLLSFADIEIPNDLDGISLKDAICDDVPLQRLYLHGEHSGNQEQSNQWIISDHYKYIWFTQTGVEQFFDLKHDPKETHNLIYEQDNQARIQKLKNLLIQELKDREEGYSDGSQLIIGKTPVTLLTK